VIDGD